MFERFTERARQVVVLAQESARVGRTEITPAHLLHGLLLEEEGLAARVLASVDVTGEMVIERLPKGDAELKSGQIAFTAESKRVLENALREALALGHNYIGTEHILLALVATEPGVADDLLRQVGLEGIRTRVVRVLGGDRGAIPRGRGSINTNLYTAYPIVVAVGKLEGYVVAAEDFRDAAMKAARGLNFKHADLRVVCEQTGESKQMKIQWDAVPV